MYPQTQNIRRKTFRSPSKQRIWAKTPLQVFTIPSVTSMPALNYLLATGDTNPLEASRSTPSSPKALLLFTDETGESQAAKSWYVSPQATLSLTSRMPTAVNVIEKIGDTPSISVWENSRSSTLRPVQYLPSSRNSTMRGTIQGTFEKEAWSLTLTVRDQQSTAGASPS